MEHLRAAVLLGRFLRSEGGLPGRELALGQGSIRALLYEPAGPPRATVLAIHGLNLQACHDPRMIAICRALQSGGYRVVCPRIEGLDALRIEVGSTERIALALEAVLDHAEYGCAKVGVFSASFAAGQCLVAASQPHLAHRISGMLLIGTFMDASALIEHVLTVVDGDDYGRLIALRGMMGSELPLRISRAVDAHLWDQSNRPTLPTLPDVLAVLTTEERLYFQALATDPVLGERLAQRILQTRSFYTERLSVLSALPGLRASVTLIHGRRDKVIPASESVRLACALRCQGNDVRLHISDLLSHGDLAPGLRLLGEIPSLVGAVAHWLGSLDSLPCVTLPRRPT